MSFFDQKLNASLLEKILNKVTKPNKIKRISSLNIIKTINFGGLKNS